MGVSGAFNLIIKIIGVVWFLKCSNIHNIDLNKLVSLIFTRTINMNITGRDKINKVKDVILRIVFISLRTT